MATKTAAKSRTGKTVKKTAARKSGSQNRVELKGFIMRLAIRPLLDGFHSIPAKITSMREMEDYFVSFVTALVAA